MTHEQEFLIKDVNNEQLVIVQQKMQQAFALLTVTPDKRVQRTLRRFKAAFEGSSVAGRKEDETENALAQELTHAIGINYGQTINTRILRENYADKKYVDKGGNLVRTGQSESELDEAFLKYLAKAGILTSKNTSTVTEFMRLTKEAGYQSFSTENVTSAFILERLNVALTKYVDQKYFPKSESYTSITSPVSNPLNTIS